MDEGVVVEGIFDGGDDGHGFRWFGLGGGLVAFPRWGFDRGRGFADIRGVRDHGIEGG